MALSAAVSYATSHPKAHVVVFESGLLPSGASTKNAGFACFGSPIELLDDLANEPEDQVLSRVEDRIRGLEILKVLLGEKEIGYENFGSYELFTNQNQQVFESTLNQLPQQSIGICHWVLTLSTESRHHHKIWF